MHTYCIVCWSVPLFRNQSYEALFALEFSRGDFGNVMAFWGILYQLNLSFLPIFTKRS